MKTIHKIAAARALYRVVHAGRKMLSREDTDFFVRDGVTYELDLSQGIDFAIFLANSYERSTKATLRELVSPASLVLDIGANIGAHTLLMAQLVGPSGRVMAFEPTQFAFQKLIRNVQLNPSLANRVDARHFFLTANDSASFPSSIYSSWPLELQGGLHAKHLGQEKQVASAKSRSLDSVLSEASDCKVALVKLDVDGFECDVLRGATAMLREMQPIFVMELAPYVLKERGSSLEELISFFEPNGYKFYHERTRQPMPSSAREMSRMVRDGEGINIVARAD